MCHLSIEKALKGLYAERCEKNPPKTHNLNYFCEEINIGLNEKQRNFIDKLDGLSVPTRYPDELDRLLKNYKKNLTTEVLNQTEELLLCLKKML